MRVISFLRNKENILKEQRRFP